MRNLESRNVLMDMITRYGYQVPEAAEGLPLWAYCYSLVHAIANKHDALPQLYKCIWKLDRTVFADRFAAAVRKLLQSEIFTLHERLSFIHDIAGYISAEEVNSYYQEVTSDVPHNALASIEDLIDALEGLSFPYEPCHPLILLTEAIGRRATSGSAQQAAREWSDALAGFIDERIPGLTPGAERRRLAAFRQSAAGHGAAGAEQAATDLAATDRVIIVHVVEPWGPNQDHYLSRILMYRGRAEPEYLSSSDTARDLNGIREKFIAELQGVIKRLSRFDDNLEIQLEFFLPRRLLGHPVENWSSQPSGRVSLGMHYVVVVRDLDRLGDPVLWQACKRKWRSAHETDDESAPGQLFHHWITCADPPVELPEVLSDRCVALGLTFPPPPQGQRTDLVDVLDAGTPIALWPRSRCDHSGATPAAGTGDCLGTRFKADVCARIAGRKLADLPSLVWQMRRETRAGDGPGLVLLWDDPAHFPGVSQHRLASPDRLEEP
jgi:hypothetical protein